MAYENDILTRNDDDELSVRVVQSTGDNPAVAYDDIYTRDDNGKLAVRVVGAGGGGDTHNKGYFATPEALRTAYPTAQPGDFAIVESTDTVWVWDSDTSDWKDSDTKGQVTSVNNQTGAVTVQETLVSGTNIKTVDGNSLLGSGNLELSTYLPFPNTWTTTGTTKALCDDIAADTSAVKGKAYLGEVTCSDLPASMGNAEIVVEIMDGTTAANKVIVLTLTSGNTAPYMWKYTYWNGGTDVSGWQTWATSAQGAKADTAVQPGDLATVATTGAYSDLTGTPTIPAAQVNSDWNASSGVAEILNKPTLATVATSGAYSDLTGTPTIPAAIQVSTMPTAAVGELDKIYQYVGTTDANYTNGYFYKCVSDGQDPATYSWTQTDVQPQASGLPDQTGKNGKFLTTNGTDASWSNEIPSVVLKSNHNYTLEAFGNNLRVMHTFNNNTTTVFTIDGASGNVQCPKHGILGYNGNYLSKVVTQKIGRSDSAASDISVPVIAGTMAVQVTTVPTAGSTYVGQIYQYIGTTDSTYTHGYIYECARVFTPSTVTSATQTTGSSLSNITVDAAVYTAKFYSTAGRLPDADTVNFTYVASSSTWKVSGYRMSASGQLLTDWGISCDGTPANGDVIAVETHGGAVSYAWQQTNVQPSGGSGLPSQTGNAGKFLTTDGTDASWATVDTLPSQTGQSGKFLTTDGTNASWSDKPLVNTATGFNTIAVRSQSLGIAIQNAVAIGVLTNVKTQCVAIGYGATATDGISAVAIGFQANCARFGVAIGPDAKTTQSSAIQLGTGTNSNANTFKVGNANGNFEIMSADGTIPTDRFTTTPVADGTYVPTLTISSGTATRTWGAAASAPVVPATMPTLAVADWSSNTQTVNVTGVTASNIVFVSPAPASAADYAAAGIVCTAQGSGTLTFTCTTVPSNVITVNVVILG